MDFHILTKTLYEAHMIAHFCWLILHLNKHFQRSEKQTASFATFERVDKTHFVTIVAPESQNLFHYAIVHVLLILDNVTLGNSKGSLLLKNMIAHLSTIVGTHSDVSPT